MSLLDDLKNVNVAKGPKCSVARMLEQLKPEEAEAVLNVIDDHEASLTALSLVLKKYDFSLTAKTLRRHRQRNNRGIDGCACK